MKITVKSEILQTMSLIIVKELAFEIFHLFTHHWKVQLNVVLMTADDSEKVKFKLIQHLNIEQITTSTLKTSKQKITVLRN